jgi:hypothetical protein
MKRLSVYIDGDLEERFQADMESGRRGPQGEIEYLLGKGLAAVEAEKAILAGKTQIDMAALGAS